MDKDWQDALFEGWADTEPLLGRRKSTDTQPDPPTAKTPTHSARDSESKRVAAEDPKGEEGEPGSETGMPSEPPSPQPQTPLKKRPASTRPSAELFRTPPSSANNNNNNDGDDEGKSKGGDNSSIDSNDERRLSDKVKKAWRGVTGQRLADPLEQWMVKHSGGTLRDTPVKGPSRRESSDKQ